MTSPHRDNAEGAIAAAKSERKSPQERAILLDTARINLLRSIDDSLATLTDLLTKAADSPRHALWVVSEE